MRFLAGLLTALFLAGLIAVAMFAGAHANPSSLPVFLGRGAAPVVFRSKVECFQSTPCSPGTTLTKPSGIAVGDVAVVVITQQNNGTSTLTTTSGSAWNGPVFFGNSTGGCGGSNCTSRYFWKVLNSTDVSNSWVVDAANFYMIQDYVGNGATTVSTSEIAETLGTSLSFPGFVPKLSSRGAMAAVFSGSGVGACVGVITAPGSVAVRVASGAGASGSGAPCAQGSDILGYAGGSVGAWSVTWPDYGALFEFSGP